MQYIKLTNDVPEIYSIGQLRRDNPNVSFPKNPTESLLADWNMYPFTTLDRPEFNFATQNCVKGDITEVNGIWSQGWVVENKPQEEAEANVRSMRDELLQKTDWMALSDNTLTQPWADYRQALRDVTAQAGFPYSVTWPEVPGATSPLTP